MGTTAERMASMSKGGSKNNAFIGFDEDVLLREFQRAFKELDTLGKKVETKDIRRIQRASLKPMVQKFKDGIKDEQDFTVYRYGGIYAEIPKGTLKESIGIITTRIRKKQTYSALSVGARVKGKFADVEKGGWFAHFIEYGFVNKDGKYIKGANYKFAERAKKGGLTMVRNTFKTLMKVYLDKQTKASIK